MIDCGADVNTRNIEDGRTPLHYAVLCERMESARILLKRGADVNSPDFGMETPLDLATRKADSGGMIAGSIKALLLRHKNDYYSACFDVASAGPSAV